MQALDKVRKLRMPQPEHDVYSASSAGDIVSVRAALAAGQSANTRGEYARTCLITAVKKGHKEVFAELLQQEDCDLSLEDSFKRTALHWACELGRVGMVRQLASHPRQHSLNSKDQFERTAIMKAVCFGETECVVALGLVARVDLDIRDDKGRSLEEMAR